MNHSEGVKQENSPFIQLLLLGLTAVGGLIICTFLSFLLIFWMNGKETFHSLTAISGGDPAFANELKILLTGQQIGLFLFPALFLAYYERKSIFNFYQNKPPAGFLLLLVVAMVVTAIPFLGWLNEWNQQIIFPEFLKGIEDWMRRMEEEGARSTQIILKMNGAGDVLINLFVIALVPAVCEELMFRGAIQRTLSRSLKNVHLAIFFSAVAFSAMHLQFFGFFPRLFLGLAFSYLYLWSGSLWYPMVAHFINNAYAVLVAFYLQMNHRSLDETEEMGWYVSLISILIATLLALYFYRHPKNNQNLSK